MTGRLAATMRAVVLRGPGEYGVEEVSVPQAGLMEALCRVDTCFICGTDPHIIRGDYPGFWPKGYPFIPGHEWSGTVVALGPGAAGFAWRIGDRVAGTSHAGCGYCRMCRTGRYNLCENYGNEERGHRQYGHYSPGAYAEYVVHSIRSLTKVPSALSLEEAALLDPASIALHTIKRSMLAPGDTVTIIGPGPMGLLVLLCARAMGADRVIVVGRGERLATAKRLGAEAIDYTVSDPVAAVQETTCGGSDVVIECAGAPTTLAQALAMVRKGGRVAAIGIPLQDASLPVRKLVLDEISLHGVRANQNTCEEILPLLVSRRVDPRPLITHRFPLQAFAEALAHFEERRGGAIKVAVKPCASVPDDHTAAEKAG
jgi:L-iditol 2-dehydrogenase